MADQISEGKLSAFLQRRRILESIQYIFGKVLDVGCGNGALAQYVSAENYTGIEPDDASRETAIALHPSCRFFKALPEIGDYDTIVILAVIEHVDNPADYMKRLASLTRGDTNSRIIISTPHPCGHLIHEFGAKIKLFSHHAAEEHHGFLNHEMLKKISPPQWHLQHYHRFLTVFNQLAVYKIKQ